MIHAGRRSAKPETPTATMIAAAAGVYCRGPDEIMPGPVAPAAVTEMRPAPEPRRNAGVAVPSTPDPTRPSPEQPGPSWL